MWYSINFIKRYLADRNFDCKSARFIKNFDSIKNFVIQRLETQPEWL